MEHIRDHLKRFRRSQQSRKRRQSSPPALPSLLDERPRPLTAIGPSPEATANSGLFQSLPPEIRRHVLVEAFGERTLHLDLRLEHPLEKSRKMDSERPKRHANAQLFDPSLRDFTRPLEWTWWSSVCHRCSPSRNFHRRPPGVGLRSEEPALDCCRDPSEFLSHSYELYPGSLPEKCFVGVLGWVLTCRRAYIEGIDVLYSTNRFHVAHAGLAICLPRLLPPRHVASINEVELLWNLSIPSVAHFLRNSDNKDELRDSDRLAMLAHLPQSFPNLRYLYLSIVDGLRTLGPWAIGGREAYEATEEVLRAVDAVVKRMSRLQECRVALPSTMYSTRKLVEKGRDIAWRYADHLEPEALWRTIPAADIAADVANNNQFICGYWIVHGRQDLRTPPTTEAF